MDGAFPLSAQIAEAKAFGAALWHRDGDELAARRESHQGFFDAVSKLARLPLIPGPGSVVIRNGESVLGAAGASGASGDDDRACVEAGLGLCSQADTKERPRQLAAAIAQQVERKLGLESRDSVSGVALEEHRIRSTPRKTDETRGRV